MAIVPNHWGQPQSRAGGPLRRSVCIVLLPWATLPGLDLNVSKSPGMDLEALDCLPVELVCLRLSFASPSYTQALEEDLVMPALVALTFEESSPVTEECARLVGVSFLNHKLNLKIDPAGLAMLSTASYEVSNVAPNPAECILAFDPSVDRLRGRVDGEDDQDGRGIWKTGDVYELVDPIGCQQDSVGIDSQIPDSSGHLRHGASDQIRQSGMQRGIPQPLEDDVIEATVVGHEPVEDLLPELGIQHAFGNPVHGLPTLMVGCTHGAAEITVVRGLHLEHAIADRLHRESLSCRPEIEEQ